MKQLRSYSSISHGGGKRRDVIANHQPAVGIPGRLRPLSSCAFRSSLPPLRAARRAPRVLDLEALVTATVHLQVGFRKSSPTSDANPRGEETCNVNFGIFINCRVG